MKHRRPYLPVAMLERREKRLQMREDRLTGKVAQKIILDDMAFADQSATIAAKDAEIERLREELAFYADPDNWKSPSRGFALQYDPEPSPVHKVRHARAAAALNPQEPPK